jgi:hypothetical protein
MKRILILCAILLAGLALWSQTAAEILSSKDVIAYVCNAGAFLLDVNTGKEVKIPMQGGVTSMLWDKTGTHLYRVNYIQNFGSGSDSLMLSEIQLPSLQEKVLLDIPVDGSVTLNLSVEMGTDGRIYLYELIEEYDEYEDEYYRDWYVYYFYNPETGKMEEMKEGEMSAATYSPAYLKKIVTDGYGIKNEFTEHPSGLLYELFITDNPKTQNPQYRQLTHFDPQGENINPNGKLTDFWVSPNDSLIVYSYHYYISDPGGDFGFNHVITRDGKKTLPIPMASSIKEMKGMTWTPDSRLIFCQEQEKPEAKVLLCVMNKDLKAKTLKTLDQYDYPKVYYRHR